MTFRALLPVVIAMLVMAAAPQRSEAATGADSVGARTTSGVGVTVTIIPVATSRGPSATGIGGAVTSTGVGVNG